MTQDSLSIERVGISISEVAEDGYRLAQDLARHLLARSATLLYGGDLREGGFTEFILDEAMILQDRVGAGVPVVENHLAWPLYLASPEVIAWQARYSQVMRTTPHDIPRDISDGIDANTFLEPVTPENSYVWSRCLTQMREESIASSTVRICAGGKRLGYKGKMPGVLEEILLTLAEGKPIFLLGGFGGVVADVCEVIIGSNVPDALSEQWQQLHNSGYADLQDIARSKGQAADYSEAVGTLQATDISSLANLSGLSEQEYRRLMATPFVDECFYLILKGLGSRSETPYGQRSPQ